MFSGDVFFDSLVTNSTGVSSVISNLASVMRFFLHGGVTSNSVFPGVFFFTSIGVIAVSMQVVSSFGKSFSTVTSFDTDFGFSSAGFCFQDASLFSGQGSDSSGNFATVSSGTFGTSSTIVVVSCELFFDPLVNDSIVEDSTGVLSSLISTLDLVVTFLLQTGVTSNSVFSGVLFVTSIDAIAVSMRVASSLGKSISTVTLVVTDLTGILLNDTFVSSGVGTF